MNDETTEILISKFLDSEITPAEQRILEAKLSQDADARDLLESLRQLRDQASRALNDELGSVGRSPEELFAAAASQSVGHRNTVTTFAQRYWQVAAALAVGVLIGTQAFRLNQYNPSSADPAVSKAITHDAARVVNNETSYAATDNGRDNPNPNNNSSSSSDGNMSAVDADEQKIARARPNGQSGPTATRPRTPQPDLMGRPGGAVDWYTYTDQTGNRWLLQKPTNTPVRRAAHNGDL